MEGLPDTLARKLTNLGTRLIDHKRAQLLIEPTQNESGYWFGGGNAVRDPNDNSLLLIGRYRDAGDSRTGLAQGPRGRELAIFRSTDDGVTWEDLAAVFDVNGSTLTVSLSDDADGFVTASTIRIQRIGDLP